MRPSADRLTSKRDREERKDASGLSRSGEDREAWDKRGHYRERLSGHSCIQRIKPE